MDKNFEKELKDLDKSGLKRSLFRQSEFKGVNLSSNDYLGLSLDPRVRVAAVEAVQIYGTGGTSSRLLAGTFDIHSQLEKKLADFFSKEAALIFSSGYHVNTGLFSILAGAGDIIFVDRLCHASILDGIKLSEARFATFDHNNLEDLNKMLSDRRGKYSRAWVVTEGIFSMDGDRAPIKDLVELAHKHEALVYLDEAHSVGVLGPDGRGLAAEENVLNQIDVFVGTLSKSLASQGGFVAAEKTLIELIISRCRSFIYTTALAPASIGAAAEALRLFPELEGRRRNILSQSESLRNKMAEFGFDTGKSSSQIIPVLTGEIEPTRKLSDHLLSHGFFVPSIRPPTVPVGQGRVRLSLTHPVLQNGLDQLAGAFASYKSSSRKIEKIV